MNTRTRIVSMILAAALLGAGCASYGGSMRFAIGLTVGSPSPRIEEWVLSGRALFLIA